jgi:large subunit ribosomal protein L13
LINGKTFERRFEIKIIGGIFVSHFEKWVLIINYLIKNLVESISYKTQLANKNTVQRGWVVVDADSQILGRLASRVARIIRGKHKASYTPHVDCGDRVIVINADKIRLTGKKWSDKQYVRHTGYPGGQRVATPLQLKAKSSSLIVENAVRGMLPKNRLGRKLFRNLYVYNDGQHPHEAQNPQVLKF